MHFSRIQDQPEWKPFAQYHLAFFASGFEKRSTFVASKLEVDVANEYLILGFSEHKDTLSRRDNDKFFFDKFKQSPLIPNPASDDLAIFRKLNSVLSTATEDVRVLVDYSVMTRSWYGSILNWLRLASGKFSFVIDFVYSHGTYLAEFDPLQIQDIASVDGFEGVVGGKHRTSAFLGLGFDKYATLAVYERIEPDELICFVVGDRENPSMAQQVREDNEALIALARATISLPISSVEEQFRILCEYAADTDKQSQIAFVPMGPKPLCLASLLACVKYRGATCLHAKGIRGRPVDVVANGQLTVTRVAFRPVS